MRPKYLPNLTPLPPFAALGLEDQVNNGKEVFVLPKESLYAFMRLALRYYSFDATTYRDRHGDIFAAAQRDPGFSAQLHYIEHGYFEGRRLSPQHLYPEDLQTADGQIEREVEGYYDAILSALDLAANGAHAVALAQLEQVNAAFPAGYQVKFFLLCLCMQTLRLHRAAEIAAQAQAMRPDDMRVTIYGELATRVTGKYRAQLGYLNTLLTQNPGDVVVLLRRAEVEWRLGRLQDLARTLTRLEHLPDLLIGPQDRLRLRQALNERRARVFTLLAAARRATLSPNDTRALATSLIAFGKPRAAAMLVARAEADNLANAIDDPLGATEYLLATQQHARAEAICANFLPQPDGNSDIIRQLLLKLNDFEMPIPLQHSALTGLALESTLGFIAVSDAYYQNGQITALLDLVERAATAPIDPYQRARNLLRAIFHVGACPFYEPRPEPDINSLDGLTTRIPLRCHQFWNTPHLPEDVARAMAEWRDVFGADHTRYDTPSAREYIQTHFGADHAALFDACYHPAMEADFFRLCVLYQEGGIYIDADDVHMGGLPDLLRRNADRDGIFLSTGTGEPYFSNNFIAVIPRHPAIAHALARAVAKIREAHAAGIPANIWNATGPGVLTEGVMSCLGHDTKNSDIFFKANICVHNDLFINHVADTVEMSYKSKPEGSWGVASLQATRQAQA